MKQISVARRNARLAADESTIGVSPILQILTAPHPANCAAAHSGTVLVQMTLPADFLSAPSGGTVSKLGVWSGTAVAAGNAASYRIYDSTLATCHEQGTVTATGGGGDMTLNNIVIAIGQTVTVDTATTTASNA